MRRPSNKRTFHVAHRLRTTATRSRCRGGNAAHDRWRCTCALGVGAPMYRSKLRSTTSSAAPSAPLQYRELDLCAGGAARSRLSGAPPFASVVAHASAMPDTGVARLGPDALELEQVWSPRVRTTPGEKRSCPGTYARLPPRRSCKYARPAALFDERSDRQVSCGSPEPLVPRAKTRGFAAVDDLSTIRLPHDACVCRGELASDWCEKPVLTARSRAASRAFATACARY